eukprot:COSAG05_NODE_23047_length_260_cov_1.267081_1_plen_68_part_10
MVVSINQGDQMNGEDYVCSVQDYCGISIPGRTSQVSVCSCSLLQDTHHTPFLSTLPHRPACSVWHGCR